MAFLFHGNLIRRKRKPELLTVALPKNAGKMLANE